jgi:hypothetical protein
MLLYVIFKNNSWKEGLCILLCIGLMIFVTDRLCSGWCKPTVARWRPTRDPEIMYLIDTVLNYRGGRFGFFSGHASNTFCVATFLITFLSVVLLRIAIICVTLILITVVGITFFGIAAFLIASGKKKKG